MNTLTRILIICLLAMAATAILIVKSRSASQPAAAARVTPAIAAADISALPRLVDLGAGKCIPCKMMKPVLDELRFEYADTFEIEFIDVWENPDAGKAYNIRMIPTQIFYGAAGKELFRHEGFFGKEDILAKWSELGVTPLDTYLE
jgi:thioredoxin 1